MITYTIGDAAYPWSDGRGDILIAHVCNNRGGWGKGFVKALSARWPHVEQQYRDRHSRWGLRLGSNQIVQAAPGVYVANMIAQDGYASRDNPRPLDYGALYTCLFGLVPAARNRRASIHMPRIGCGLAGGNWSTIEPMIARALGHDEHGGGIPVTVYDLLPQA